MINIKFFQFACFLFGFSLSSLVLATGTPGNTGKFMPRNIEISPNFVYVRLSPDVAANLQNVDNCELKDVLVIPNDDPILRAEMISVVLASLSFGKPLSGWVPKCGPVHFDNNATAPYLGTMYMHAE